MSVAGCSRRASLQDCSSRPMPRPVSRIVVRSGIWWAIYIAVSVLPVPGGPYKSMPRLIWRLAARNLSLRRAKLIVSRSMRSSIPAGRMIFSRSIAGKWWNCTSIEPRLLLLSEMIWLRYTLYLRIVVRNSPRNSSAVVRSRVMTSTSRPVRGDISRGPRTRSASGCSLWRIR